MSASDHPMHVVSRVTIGCHRIGPGERVFVVAEAGVNHNGCLETALRMVDAAAEAGADAVKFQMFRADNLVTASASTSRYQRDACGEVSQQAMLSRLELPLNAFAELKKHCDERSVVFIATPFGVAEVRHLARLGAEAVKIASTDLTNVPLLDAATATGLPIIVSTGASTEAEIRDGVDRLLRSGAAGRLVLLHCVSCYPTPVEAANLRAIASLEQTFGVPCGLSDHTTSTQVGAWAVAAGACTLEKHFTLDPSSSGPDHAMSLDPRRLADYISAVRDVERALGDGTPGMTARESDVRAAAGRSVVAAADITKGARLTADMLTLKRPGTGIGAAELHRLVDRHAAVDIGRDTIMSWDMVR